jgi:colanic acid/amylovoran biosynthesis glycosyltransferase
MRVAYLINQYPMISTTFIRREILALERQGIEVQRMALRGWDAKVVDKEDEREQMLTRYVLQDGIRPLVWAALRVLVTAPRHFLSGLRLAISMGRRSDRPIPYHLIYLAEACRILPWLKSSGAAHVHTHFGTNGAEVAMLVHVLGGPPYSFTVHGPIEFDKPQLLGIDVKVRRAAFVVAITSFARSQLYRWVDHAHWPKVKVIHCGLEPAFFAELSSPSSTLPRLVCVGRLSAEKGQLLLIEAAARLAAKGIYFELVLVGGGEMYAELEALIIKLALGKQIRLTGSITTEQLREEILLSRALVLASFAEGLPMVIMEAMALRRPVLSTDIAGIPELIKPGKNGWLIPAGSIDALVMAMEDVLSRSNEEVKLMGESAFDCVLRRHSVDIQAEKLIELFRASRP